MPCYRLAFMGFGNVACAFAKLLLEKQEELISRYDINFSVVGIATRHHGMTINPNGINLEVVRTIDQINDLSILTPPNDGIDFIQKCGADILFENTPVNYETGQPALNYVRTALELGKHVVTANKGPLVHAYHELAFIAKKNGCKFYFESTVMDGAPIFSLFRNTLPAIKLISFQGVLNSTSNMILTQMEKGDNLLQAVKYCQQIGIAETDPNGDIDGWDSAIKISVLVTVLMGIPNKPAQVDRQGIRQISSNSIHEAHKNNLRWKLICSAVRKGDGVVCKVSPKLVGVDSPFYYIDGTTSIIQFNTDNLGLLSIVEENPSPRTTAYGLLADFINIARSEQPNE
jgi:homoserine dehydrogenase